MPRNKERLLAKLWNNDFAVEKPVILRMPNEQVAAKLQQLVKSAPDGFELPLELVFDGDSRGVTVVFDGEQYRGQVKKLPCLTEVYTTEDRKTMHKLSNITKIIDCTAATHSDMADALTYPMQKIVQKRRKSRLPGEFTVEAVASARKLIIEDYEADEFEFNLLESSKAAELFATLAKRNLSLKEYPMENLRGSDDGSDTGVAETEEPYSSEVGEAAEEYSDNEDFEESDPVEQSVTQSDGEKQQSTIETTLLDDDDDDFQTSDDFS